MMISSLYAAILALLFIALSVFVIHGRWTYRIGLGDGGNADMIRRVRIHANFAEFVPFALLLLVLLDYMRFNPLLIHALGIALVAGRIGHALGLMASDKISAGRAAGVLLTYAVILICAALLIWRYVFVAATPL